MENDGRSTIMLYFGFHAFKKKDFCIILCNFWHISTISAFSAHILCGNLSISVYEDQDLKKTNNADSIDNFRMAYSAYSAEYNCV